MTWLEELDALGLLAVQVKWTPDGELIVDEGQAISSLQADQFAAVFAAHQDEKPFTVGPPLPFPAPPGPPPETLPERGALTETGVRAMIAGTATATPQHDVAALNPPPLPPWPRYNDPARRGPDEPDRGVERPPQ